MRRRFQALLDVLQCAISVFIGCSKSNAREGIFGLHLGVGSDDENGNHPVMRYDRRIQRGC